MKVDNIPNIFKIADAAMTDGTIEFLFLDDNDAEYFETNENINVPVKIGNTRLLKMNYSRIYLIMFNGRVVKMRSSESSKGMAETLAIYKNGGINASPSISSYGGFL